METTEALLRMGQAQQMIRYIMENLNSRNCSKHDPFWEEEGDTGEKLDEIRRHLSGIYEQMSELHNLLWDDDER